MHRIPAEGRVFPKVGFYLRFYLWIVQRRDPRPKRLPQFVPVEVGGNVASKHVGDCAAQSIWKASDHNAHDALRR